MTKINEYLELKPIRGFGFSQNETRYFLCLPEKTLNDDVHPSFLLGYKYGLVGGYALDDICWVNKLEMPTPRFLIGFNGDYENKVGTRCQKQELSHWEYLLHTEFVVALALLDKNMTGKDSVVVQQGNIYPPSESAIAEMKQIETSLVEFAAGFELGCDEFYNCGGSYPSEVWNPAIR